MHYKIELLACAWEELDQIADIYLNLAGAKSAQNITDKILDTIELLSDNPFLGVVPKYSEIADQGFRMLICDKYLCFYKVGADVIKVYHIADGRNAYPNLFGKS